MDIKNSIEAIFYIVKKLNRSCDRWSVLKLLFFADRYHIRKYSRTVTDDMYYAMENGPVASIAYDVLKNKIDEESMQNYINFLFDFDYSEKTVLAKNVNPELDTLSDTDKEALNYAITTFGEYSPEDIKEISHKYPEWKRFEETLKSGRKREMIVMDDFFQNPDETSLKEYPTLNADPFNIIPNDIVEVSREMYFGIE